MKKTKYYGLFEPNSKKSIFIKYVIYLLKCLKETFIKENVLPPPVDQTFYRKACLGDECTYMTIVQ